MDVDEGEVEGGEEEEAAAVMEVTETEGDAAEETQESHGEEADEGGEPHRGGEVPAEAGQSEGEHAATTAREAATSAAKHNSRLSPASRPARDGDVVRVGEDPESGPEDSPVRNRELAAAVGREPVANTRTIANGRRTPDGPPARKKAKEVSQPCCLDLLAPLPVTRTHRGTHPPSSPFCPCQAVQEEDGSLA